MRILASCYLLARRIRRRVKMAIIRPAFKRCGRNFNFDPDGWYSYGTIEVGDDVTIGAGAVFMAPDSGIVIGDKVMFGPNVTIMGGDHNTSEVGKFMRDVHRKRPEDDQAVTIESDVWVGSGVTILKGVRIGRGSIVGAAAVVTRDLPPYSISFGIPARVRQFRFDDATRAEHDRILYQGLPADRAKTGIRYQGSGVDLP